MPGSLAHALAALVLGAAAWLAAAPVDAPAPAVPVETPAVAATVETPAAAAAVEAPAPPPEAAAPPPAAPAARRGLWVLCEGSQRVLERADRVEGLLDDAKALGATDLFVQVYRGGRAWFDSSLADSAPWQTTWRAAEPPGADALATLIERAHAAGLRVHAWVNVLSLGTNAEAPLLRELGAGAVLVDQWGRSLLDYPGYDVPAEEAKSYRIGTPAIYLDPAAPGVAERLAATFEELLRRYPGLDGLHLDYIRFPDVLPYLPGTRFGVGLSFGYGAATRARFEQETGLPAPFAEQRENAERFDAWRREQLSALVGRIAGRARAARPGVALSAAVYPDHERAYQGLFQDWRGWLEAGHLDVAVPMLYVTDERMFRYQVAELAGLPEAGRIWIGLGSWLFAREPARAVAQTQLVASRPPLGVAFFSWDSIREQPALREALRDDGGAAASGGAVSELDAFDYALPPERIAQEPAEPRDAARLLVLERGTGARHHGRVRDLPDWLRPGDLLVRNATRVLPARLRGRKASGGAAEALLLEGAGAPGRFRALLRAGGRLREGQKLRFEGGGLTLDAELSALAADGSVELVFAAGASPYDLGEAPLPPYIRRPAPRSEDAERYQTVYARVPGAVAAPTAGLHFTPALFEALAARGVACAEVVLHVGPGTFRPLREEDLARGRLHAERYELPAATAEAVGRAREAGGRVIAIGTTTARVLEHAAREDGGVTPGAGETELLLRPGSRFRAVDALLTNFHLPRSSLLLLVAAFAGREPVLAAYAEALTAGYRFYSYGDAMLIL